MSSKETNKKNAADFSTERSEYFMRQSQGAKLVPPRIQPTTSAKASKEVSIESEEVNEVEVDSEKTVKAVMEALETVGEDVSQHLTKKDKDFIRKTCLNESDTTTTLYAIILVIIGITAGYMLQKKY